MQSESVSEAIVTVIYDGQCRLCRASINWLQIQCEVRALSFYEIEPKSYNLTLEDLDLLIPHQANLRIAEHAFDFRDDRILAHLGAALIGDGATALKGIRAIGNDMALDPGIGNCGKAGQWVPVGVGQPTLMIGGLTVGGFYAHFESKDALMEDRPVPSMVVRGRRGGSAITTSTPDAAWQAAASVPMRSMATARAASLASSVVMVRPTWPTSTSA